jgi:hypothetical protein
MKKNIKTLVITSIHKPNKIIKEFSKICKKNSVHFILVADKKTPKFVEKNINILSLEEQMKLPFRTSKLLPLNSYSRKNIGYLLAIYKNFKEIYETDDDNFPYQDFFNQNLNIFKNYFINRKGYVNIYNYFLSKEQIIWPRGLPLSKIPIQENKNNLKYINKNLIKDVSIVQRLCDGNPDVDAIFRLINKDVNINFKKKKSFLKNFRSYIPFNSQNTLWHEKAHPLMYLPSYCTMRATDIWRSYVTTFICNKLNLKILFSSPTVVQYRNLHDLNKDFKLEIPVFRDVEKFTKALESVKIYKNSNYILVNLFNCYKKLVKEKIFEKKELEIVYAWCKDINSIKKHLVKI